MTSTSDRAATTSDAVGHLLASEPGLVVTEYRSGDFDQLCFASYAILRVRELYKFRHALKNAVISKLKRRYRRSSLGFAWSLISPLLTMALLSFVFGAIFQQNYKTFSVYVFSALLPWNLISQTVLQSTESLIGNESSLKHFVLPKTFFPLTTVLTEVVNFTLGLISFLFLGLLLGANYSWSILALPLAIAVTGLLGVGLSIIIAVAAVYWRDMTHILGVVMQMLFYTIPVIYPVSALPAQVRWIVEYNVFYHFIKLFRVSIYEGRFPSVSDWMTCSAIAVSVVILSLFLLKRTERELIFRL